MDDLESFITDALLRATAKPDAGIREKCVAAWQRASEAQRKAEAAGKPERLATWAALGKTAAVLAAHIAALEARIAELEARK